MREPNWANRGMRMNEMYMYTYYTLVTVAMFLYKFTQTERAFVFQQVLRHTCDAPYGGGVSIDTFIIMDSLP